jgi:hypothetical protein
MQPRRSCDRECALARWCLGMALLVPACSSEPEPKDRAQQCAVEIARYEHGEREGFTCRDVLQVYLAARRRLEIGLPRPPLPSCGGPGCPVLRPPEPRPFARKRRGPRRGRTRNEARPADRARMNIHAPHEVRYWTKALSVTEEQLKEAVAKAGVMVEAVKTHLGK